VEEDGFEPLGPGTTKLCDRRNHPVLDPPRFKQGNGDPEAGFCGALHQKIVGNENDPMRAYAKELALRKKSGATPSDCEGVSDMPSSDNDPRSLSM
jgi:hypothetical protein